ncbi:MAG: hypothetical protein AB1411_14420 [Nitrospirota bacterium]
MNDIRLSKSKFLSGLQCPKRLYLEIHHPDLAAEPDEQTRAILERGTGIGALARARFPGGVLVEADHRHLARPSSRPPNCWPIPWCRPYSKEPSSVTRCWSGWTCWSGYGGSRRDRTPGG